MPSTVDAEALEGLVAMGLSPEDAADCLKACKNDPNQAAEYYLNGDLDKQRSSQKWDDSIWDQPRDGPSATEGHSFNNNWTTSAGFQIQGNDIHSPNLHDGTKSRPSSPMLFGCRGPNDDQDPDLAEALKQSMQDVPGNDYAAQETGITGTHTSPTVNPNFIPAHENKEYNPSEWALMTIETQEVSREPPPAERKRAPGTPAFLRPSFSSYHLAGALTILHSIPRARDALLTRRAVAPNYRYSPKWWAGDKIVTSRIVGFDNLQFNYDDALEELEEIQRLMAFLDNTDRAYGSVEVLGDLPKVREQDQTSVIATFFGSLDLSLSYLDENQDYRDLKVFSSVAHQMQTDGTDREQAFWILDTPISQSDTSLYCALDNMMWADEEQPVYVELADVLIFQAKTDADVQGSAIDVPTILYLDRYTKPWLQSVKDVKGKIAAQKSRIIDLEAKEERLKSFWSSATGYSPKTLLEITIAHFATSLRTHVDDSSGDVTMDSRPEPPDPTPLLKELLRKLEKNLLNLERQKEEAQDALQKLQRTFTSPEDCPPGSLPLTKYSLRGVCPTPHLTYVLQPDRDQPSKTKGTSEQWWRCSWNAQTNGWGEVQYGTHETIKVSEEEVLHEAKTRGDTVLLVFATDQAFEGADPSLPEPLKMFVKHDNNVFAAELEPPSFPRPPSPLNPEKKRRQSSLGDEEMRDQSPKRYSTSTRSSATLGMATPLESPVAGIQEIELPPPTLPPIEMTERGGHIAPVAKVIIDGKALDTEDHEMPDFEHIETSGLLPEGNERKGG